MSSAFSFNAKTAMRKVVRPAFERALVRSNGDVLRARNRLLRTVQKDKILEREIARMGVLGASLTVATPGVATVGNAARPDEPADLVEKRRIVQASADKAIKETGGDPGAARRRLWDVVNADPELRTAFAHLTVLTWQ